MKLFYLVYVLIFILLFRDKGYLFIPRKNIEIHVFRYSSMFLYTFNQYITVVIYRNVAIQDMN